MITSPHDVASCSGSGPVMLWSIVLLLGLAQAADLLPDDHLAGPNVCKKGGRSSCCPGWRRPPGTASFCIIPMCSRSCGDGRCIRPNLCVCASGQVASSCPPAVSTPPELPNGGTVTPPQPFGPSCREPCLNGGRCIGADRCSCIYGYAGRRCERDYRTGPCFRKVQQLFCAGQLDGVVCTRQLCCVTIGVAWGHPCERCPDKMDCDRGFITDGQGGACQEVDECEAIPGLCGDRGNCVNTLGSFQCECSTGFVWVDRDCKDENECEKPGTCLNGHCVNTDGGYYCICDTGFVPTQDRKACIDTKRGNCFSEYVGGQCRNRLAVRLSKHECCCGQNIGQGWGGPPCQPCPMQGTVEHQQLCLATIILEVNECALRPGICGDHGRCIDTPKSYHCECDSGYIPTNDATQCIDVDECQNRTICQKGRCTNAPGSFHCICPQGYDLTSDGLDCTDHDECAARGMCANGDCINVDGSFKCLCHPGFVLSQSGYACVDINECAENGRICLKGRCENTPGSYRCHCRDGFVLSPDGSFCIDYNECEETGMCENGICVNADGSFKCICSGGYKLHGHTCIDVDECVETPEVCVNGRCENNEGSFRCVCVNGFTIGPGGKGCLDTRRDYCYSWYKDGECSGTSAILVTRSACCCALHVAPAAPAWGTPCTPCPSPNTPEYQQLCPRGPGSGHEGNDINECSIFPGICQNGACENLKDSYRCICNIGYEIDTTGKICSDINECAVNLLICANGQCRNTPGSFQCTCPTGYIHNVQTNVCEDVDECSRQEICIGGVCVNTIGSYRCDCPAGSTLDVTRNICIDSRKGSCWLEVRGGQCESDIKITVLRSECCATIGKAWGSPCQLCTQETRCPRGYIMLDGKTCTDVNECEIFSNICQGGGLCVNTDGSYRCNCPPGLTLDASGTKCVDLREELCYATYDKGRCLNPFGGIYKKMICCCSVGAAWGRECTPCPRVGSGHYDDLCLKGKGFAFDGDDGEVGILTDINECIEFPSLCENGRCRNTPGSFECHCNQGFDLDIDGLNCTDINECAIMHGICGNGICRNTAGAFICDCEEGYEDTMMMQMCVDVNECVRIRGLCRGGTCVNTPGSFRCDCPAGHELAPNGRSCKDIDECGRASGICSNGICENMMGTYQCVCNDGYQQTPLLTSCEDMDECAFNNGHCQTRCINALGSYTCACDFGYALLPDGYACGDVDECEDNICSGGKCTNYPGGYSCTCTEGLIPAPDGKGCFDIDECVLNTNLCMNGRCENTEGSFVCHCDVGYTVKAHGQGCTDDDECSSGSAQCDEQAECINTAGSYKCSCQAGYKGDGVICRDINECLRDNGGCDADAACINIEGSFKCSCDEGFSGDGFICEDVDECILNPYLCENGHCMNYKGGYRCECDMGFAPEDADHSCVDIDECSLFPNICVFGRCENIFGLFRCLCSPGYQLDDTGGNCTDINECLNLETCKYGTCTNLPGSFNCQCPPFYRLNADKTACIDPREGRCYSRVTGNFRGRGVCHDPFTQATTKSTCCCTVGAAWGPSCEICPPSNSTEYDLLCPSGFGFIPNPSTALIEEVDECLQFPGICEGGRCANTFGSFMCTCSDGYTLDAGHLQCLDENECIVRPGLCGAGTCMNTKGSYTCLCPPGYVLIPGSTCVDMRKSVCYRQYGDGICEHEMITNQTRMTCCCSVGRAWGDPCQPCPFQNTEEYLKLCSMVPGTIINPMTGVVDDVNECEDMVCQNGICTNTVGSFHCDCYRGYRYNSILLNCEDIDECVQMPDACVGNGRCQNTPGSFECHCSDGYKLSPDGRGCIDVDDCKERPNICRNGICINLDGGFQCTCNPGFYLSPAADQCIDIDECSRSPGICANGSCENTFGSYRCICFQGFQLVAGDCLDIDECIRQYGICRNGRCRNIAGSFECQCQQGYKLGPDTSSCIDMNECIEEDVCIKGVCRNSEGSFQCSCPTGYRPTDSDCTDIDECRESQQHCYGGTCINTDGGFQCQCPAHFQLAPNGQECIDTRVGTCYTRLEGGRCSVPRLHNVTRKECCCMRGSQAWGHCEPCPVTNDPNFKLLCGAGVGYVTVNGDVEDINECMMDPTLCANGICINIDGAYRCECNPGFTLSGDRCIDVDECRTRGVCGNGTCTNTIGAFECACREGYAPGPRITCEDVDECRDVGHMCAFRCVNIPGSFACACPYGFTLAADRKHCEDLDECATALNKCKYECKNLVGSYMCICPEGYQQVGLGDNCEDIDECSRGDICINGRCINTPGGFHCDCYDGYEIGPSKKECIDTRMGFCFSHAFGGICTTQTAGMIEISRADCCCGTGLAWGEFCELCPRRGTKEYTTLCPHGMGFTQNGHDVDECQIIPHLCKNGRCINTMGSYRCICNKGFKPDQSAVQCFDINECERLPCHQGTCINTEGSFRCECIKGYVLAADGISCEDVDECVSKHHCEQTCVNTPGSYKCTCNKGYKEQGNKCKDIDECAEEPSLCLPVGICVNTQGSFKCICPRGYTIDATGTRCTDSDECKDDSRCQHGCENMAGSYKCICPDGYSQHFYWNQCIDENECSESSLCGSANCQNTVGSYSCTCPPGYSFDGTLMICIELGCHPDLCSFGCTPVGSGAGLTCGCPDGYQRIGQGHCLSTISPNLLPDESYTVPNNDIISTEGCYSCKVGSRRSRRSIPKAREVALHLPLYLTHPDQTLLKLQPTHVQSHMKYRITGGKEAGLFQLTTSKGVSILHLTQEIKKPTEHIVEIEGKSPTDNFHIFVRLTVTP